MTTANGEGKTTCMPFWLEGEERCPFRVAFSTKRSNGYKPAEGSRKLVSFNHALITRDHAIDNREHRLTKMVMNVVFAGQAGLGKMGRVYLDGSTLGLTFVWDHGKGRFLDAKTSSLVKGESQATWEAVREDIWKTPEGGVFVARASGETWRLEDPEVLITLGDSKPEIVVPLDGDKKAYLVRTEGGVRRRSELTEAGAHEISINNDEYGHGRANPVFAKNREDPRGLREAGAGAR
ncbi:MAG: hypothetical protein KKA28_18790 [Planctomycetes bacterium]|nr:hypothetical protein [Planctomycetota bacterium]